MIKNAKQTLEWRRSNVLELSNEGRSESDIARILRVTVATINTDIQFLKQEAEENMRNTLMNDYHLNIRSVWLAWIPLYVRWSDILSNADSDSRDILQATSVKMQAYVCYDKVS